MDDLIDDMEADAKAAIEEYSGTKLTDLGIAAYELELAITEAEAGVKQMKKSLEKIMRYAIPNALTEAGIPEFGFETPDGRKPRVVMDTKVAGSLRQAPDEEAAVAYLEACGFEGGIKSVIQIDFTEDEREAAQDLMGRIEELAHKYPHMSRSVHPKTLASFARDAAKLNPDFDFKKVGLVAFPQAKFSRR